MKSVRIDSFIYQYGNEKSEIIWKQNKKIAVNSWQIQYFTDPDYYIQNDGKQLGIPMMVTIIILLVAWAGIQLVSKFLLKDL